MIKLLLTTILYFMVILFNGCAHKRISVPTLEVNKDNGYKSIEPVHDDMAHLYIYLDSAVIKPININIDNKVFDKLSYETYSNYKLKNGKHWIRVSDMHNSSFLCLDVKKNIKLLYEVHNYFKGLTGSGIELRNGSINDMIDSDLQQVKQKKQNIMSSLATNTIETFSIDINDKKDNFLVELKNNITKELNLLSMSKGNGLIIKLSVLSKQEGNQFERYLLGPALTVEEAKEAISIKIEFIVDGKKVDELISHQEIYLGILGGFKSSMYAELIENITEDIVNYTTCMHM